MSVYRISFVVTSLVRLPKRGLSLIRRLSPFSWKQRSGSILSDSASLQFIGVNVPVKRLVWNGGDTQTQILWFGTFARYQMVKNELGLSRIISIMTPRCWTFTVDCENPAIASRKQLSSEVNGFSVGS